MKLIELASRRSQLAILWSIPIVLFTGSCIAQPVTFSAVVNKAMTQIESGMEVYSGPPSTPAPEAKDRDPEMREWSSKIREERLGGVEAAESATMEMIRDGLNRGMDLKEVRARTAQHITWVDWPRNYQNRDGEPRGYSDHELSAGEWGSPKNGVVVIHQEYAAKDGIKLHYLQPTFRSRPEKSTRRRVGFSAYVVIVDGDEVNTKRILWSLDSTTLDRRLPKLLGFLERESGFPSVLMYHGVYGTARVMDIDLFVWVGEIQNWTQVYLRALDGVLWLSYDPVTTDLTCYQGSSRNSETGEIEYSVGFVWNVKNAIVESEDTIRDAVQNSVEARN
ncbi:MAG: hypothetical protein KF886_22410 [Candidatus Hydrogenedentes bacterium]|nr:hypothetical protein [Candidatus Hydrogenedentota bacterium]